jgi:serine/threonine protein kinase
LGRIYFGFLGDTPVTIKVSTSSTQDDELKKERDFHLQFRHAQLAVCHGAFTCAREGECRRALVMERTVESLSESLGSHVKLCFEELLRFGLQISNVLEFLAMYGCFLGNLNPQNIMARWSGDFILREFGNVSSLLESNSSSISFFIAPELKGSERRTTSVSAEVFGFGCCLLDLSVEHQGHLPILESGEEEDHNNWLNELSPHLEYIRIRRRSLERVILHCIQFSPDSRPSSAFLHSYFCKCKAENKFVHYRY